MKEYKKGSAATKVQQEPEVVTGWSWMYLNNGALAGISPLGMYQHLTGTYTKENIDRTNAGDLTEAELVVRDHPETAELLECLYGLFQASGYEHLLAEYKAGNVSPGLKEILDYQQRMDPNVIEAEMGADSEFKTRVWGAVQDGKISFAPYNKKGDPADDWFLKFNIRPNPIPGLFGSVSYLSYVDSTDKPSIKGFQKQIKQDLKRKVLSLLQAGLPVESLRTVASDIMKRCEALKEGETYHTYSPFKIYPYCVSPFPYDSEYDAGFAVDLKGRVIHDLRPYTKELRELLKPSYEPLRSFSYALDRDIREFRKAATERPEPQKAENDFLKDNAFLMLKNSPETNAIASASTGFSAIAIQQELPGMGGDEQIFEYKSSVSTKSGEVIIKVSEQPRGKALSPGTEKLRILFDSLYTLSGQSEFFIPIDDYMEYCRRDRDKPASAESKRKFKRKLLSNLRVLKHTSFAAQVDGVREKGEVGILGSYLPYPNNRVRITLERGYCEALEGRNKGRMQMTRAVFRLDENNPHLVTMLRKLSLNRTMYSNINQSEIRAHRISIKTLYENDASFPSITALMKSRKYRQSVIQPLINAIQILNDEGYIISRYVDKDGIEREPEELETVNFVDFIDPAKWLLEYDLLDPETGAVFQDNVEQMQAAEKRKQERKEKATLAHAKKIVAEDRKRRRLIEELNKN